MFANKSILRCFPVLLNLAIMLALLIGSAAFPGSVRAASTITVATSVDELNINGLCSLREAIVNANNDAQTLTDCVAGSGIDTILFADGITLITLGSTLPVLTDADRLTIDGGGDVTVSGNNSVRVFYVSGGAVFTLQNITVANGSFNYGAGVLNEGTLDVTDSTFSGNNATVNSGGGIANVSGATASIANSTFSGNSAAGDGGGLFNGGMLTLSNSTFTNNSASYGGGLINNSAIATIVNSTFSGNSATNGSGVATYQGGLPVQSTTIRNTILANSAAGEDCFNAAPGVIGGGNNIIESPSISCNSIATSASDPALGGLTGSPAYFPLNTGSPAIDAGDDAACAAAPVNNTSQNGHTRPQGAHCDIGSYEANATLTVKSIAADDGWVLESAETSNVGGPLNAAATTFNLGDAAADRQYRAILHFDTSGLPDTAVITKVTLKIRKQSLAGVNPFTVLGGLQVDMRKPSFGAVALAAADFQAAAGRTNVATFGATPVLNWYTALLNGPGRAYVNKTGTTQFRLRFATDDNDNNLANTMRFFSGNAAAAARPQLIVEFYVP